MKYIKYGIIYLALILLNLSLVSQADAKIIKKVAQTGLQFLKVDMAARPAAMGGAVTVAINGADAMFYNPAGLTEMDAATDFFVTRTNWLADIEYTAGALARDLGNWGVIGVNFISSDYGRVIGTRVTDTEQGFEETGDLEVGAYAIGLSYARALTNKFQVGGQVKFAAQQLGSNLMPNGTTRTNKVSGLAYDFGTIFYPGFRSFRLGMSVRNFSPQFKYEDDPFQLPLTFRIGFAMDVLDLVGGMSDHALIVDVDALHPRDFYERLHLGAEYWYADMIALRAGYKTNYDEEGLALGFGLDYDILGMGLQIDYSYSHMGSLSNVNRFTIGGTF